MSEIELTDTKKYTDVMLIEELRRRGRLKSERQTKHVVGGYLEVWEKYSTGWLVVDEVSV